jgi:3-dehydroquinate synthase
MKKLRVELGERSYSIIIGSDLLAQSGALFNEYGVKGRIMVVTNPTVARWYLEPLLNSLRSSDYQAEAVLIPDGEEYKSLEQVNRIYDELVEGKYDRKSVLIALGGGVIGDLTGFAAATYMRGIRFIQVPTTLLAQVDSSIGGKTAVNHFKGKNLIGAFYQPNLVVSDVGTFRTLPDREFSSGMVEVIKHGLILDSEYFEMLANELPVIKTRAPKIMTEIVAGSCRIKAGVVQEDEQETGLRAILNFGHTVGHALESITDYKHYKHGEAVAIGILAAFKIAVRNDILQDTGLEGRISSMFANLDLSMAIPGLNTAEIMSLLYLDKKVEYGKVRWVLPEGLGRVVISNEIPAETVKDTLLELGGV